MASIVMEIAGAVFLHAGGACAARLPGLE
jgi:hypothetical protein